MEKRPRCKWHWQDVLKYSHKKQHQSTVRRYYEHYREEKGLQDRCDIPECIYHQDPLKWNGKSLPLVLDHKEGNRFDNRPDKLRYLCPNCESQLGTRGGKNKGRVADHSSGGFGLRNDRGGVDYTMPVEPAQIAIEEQEANLYVGKN